MSYPWHTHVKVEISGKASKGTTPVALTLQILDNGVPVGSANEPAAVLGVEYFVSVELGSVNGNASGLNLGEHTLQGRVTLSNAEGTISYDTDSVTIGIGQVPVGEVT